VADSAGQSTGATLWASQGVSWTSAAWRAHRSKYIATDPGGSRRVSGRYHRGLDQFPEDRIWPALYLSLSPEVCLGEIFRHVSADLLPRLNDYRLTELRVELSFVVDIRDPGVIGCSLDDLCHDTSYEISQRIAAQAIAGGAEGILVPSATRLGDNLIVFPRQLRPASSLTVVRSRAPHLYVVR